MLQKGQTISSSNDSKQKKVKAKGHITTHWKQGNDTKLKLKSVAKMLIIMIMMIIPAVLFVVTKDQFLESASHIKPTITDMRNF